MSYYDIDAILTDAQKVPCTFEITIPGLGYLEGNSNTDIKQGTRVELPLWLAEMLGVSQRLGTEQNVVTLDLPPALAPRVQNALKADPCTVDLRSLASHYYSLGERILGLLEEDELVDILSETFKKRAAGIADHAHNPQGVISSGGEFLKGLDENERQRAPPPHPSIHSPNLIHELTPEQSVFKTAHESAKAIRAFLSDRSSSKK